jgi:hypothetical protein
LPARFLSSFLALAINGNLKCVLSESKQSSRDARCQRRNGLALPEAASCLWQLSARPM